jgi:signal transduction histidine kinase
MPSMIDSRAFRRSPEAELLEKIEELSLLRSLNDRLTAAPDHRAACRALTDLLWEGLSARRVVYYGVDPARGAPILEAASPASSVVVGADPPSLPDLSDDEGSTVSEARILDPASRGPIARVVARVRARGRTTGLLVVDTDADSERVAEIRRLLAIVATSSGLALDAARDRDREEFLATLRHDINNPVQAAVGYTEMLIDALQAEGREDLHTLAAAVGEALRAVADLVSNFLHLGAINRGAEAPECHPLDLAMLAREVARSYEPAARDKGLELTLDFRPSIAPGDPNQLRRVLANLLGNAIKYTPAPGQVRLSCRPCDQEVVLEVADSGPGIDPADVSRLFEKHVRLDRDRATPGTGLGLFIARAIVAAHGGSIEVEPAAEGGSLFRLRLPRGLASRPLPRA